MTDVYLVRHGQTALNAANRYRGLDDPPLDAVGVLQVEDTALRLAPVPLRSVVASILRRAIETAEIIAMPHGLHVEPDPRLIDIDYGPWTALTQDEAGQRDPELHAAFRRSPLTSATPAERVADARRRLTEAIEAIAHLHPADAVAIVSHDVPIRAIVAGLRGYEDEEFWAFPLPTASWVRLEITAGQTQVLTLPEG